MTVQDTKEIADKLNEFYVNSVVEINRGIGCRNIEENPEVQLTHTLPTFELKNVNVKYLEMCLLKMKLE